MNPKPPVLTVLVTNANRCSTRPPCVFANFARGLQTLKIAVYCHLLSLVIAETTFACPTPSPSCVSAWRPLLWRHQHPGLHPSPRPSLCDVWVHTKHGLAAVVPTPLTNVWLVRCVLQSRHRPPIDTRRHFHSSYTKWVRNLAPFRTLPAPRMRCMVC